MSYSSHAVKKRFDRLRIKALIAQQAITDARKACEAVRNSALTMEQDYWHAVKSDSRATPTVSEYARVAKLAVKYTGIVGLITTTEEQIK